MLNYLKMLNRIKPYIASFFFVLAFFSYCFLFFYNITNVKILNYVSPVFSSVSFNIEPTKAKSDSDIGAILKINGRNYSFEKKENSNIYIKSFDKMKISSAELLLEEEYPVFVKNFIVFNDIKTLTLPKKINFLNKNGNKKTEEICINDSCKKYYSYDIFEPLKLNKNSEYLNYESKLNELTAFFLSYFVNYKLYFLSYIFLVFGIFFNLKFNKNTKKENSFLKKNRKKIYFILVFSLFLISFLTKINQISYVPLWLDEVFSVNCATDYDFTRIFKDVGNPPLFYFFLKIFRYNFGARILPLIFGLLIPVVGFLFLYKTFKFSNKKAALVFLLLSIFNLHLIYFSNELRTYSLSALLALICFVLFSELFILKKLKKEELPENYKKYLKYSVFSSLLINSHYFGLILFFFNLIYGIFLLKKENKRLKYFIVSSFYALLTFLPFAVLSAQRALLNPEFNSWINDLSFISLNKLITYFFGGIIPFIFAIVLVIKYFKKADNTPIKKLLIYITYLLLSLFSFVILFSISRSMVLGRYFVLYLPIYFVLISIVLADRFKNSCVLAFITLVLLIFNNSNSIENLNGKRSEVTSNIVDLIGITRKKDVSSYSILKYTDDKLNLEYPRFIKNVDLKETLKGDNKFQIFSYKDFSFKEEASKIKKDCFYIKANGACVYRYKNY